MHSVISSESAVCESILLCCLPSSVYERKTEPLGTQLEYNVLKPYTPNTSLLSRLSLWSHTSGWRTVYSGAGLYTCLIAAKDQEETGYCSGFELRHSQTFDTYPPIVIRTSTFLTASDLFREEMKKADGGTGVDAYIVPTEDPHMVCLHTQPLLAPLVGTGGCAYGLRWHLCCRCCHVSAGNCGAMLA